MSKIYCHNIYFVNYNKIINNIYELLIYNVNIE